MTNIIKHKYVKCVEWILKVSSYGATYSSKSFSFENRKYTFTFSMGWNTTDAKLFLSVNGELQSPVTFTISIANSNEILQHLTKSMSTMRQEIWRYPSDNLFQQTLHVEVYFHADYSKDDKSIQTPSYTDTHLLLESISKDFSKLLNEGLNHDVNFVCGDQNIKAHKNILCSRSDVFASMLQSDMVEGNTGCVNIEDMDAIIFHEFLKYLYTGVLPELTTDIAMEFYKAGDKYAIESLKKQCGEFLTDSLSPENACEILILADQRNDANFKKNIMDYIFKEEIPIVGEKWTDFCKENSDLANEVLNLYCKHLKSK